LNSLRSLAAQQPRRCPSTAGRALPAAPGAEMIDFSRNHYALFGLPERFRCDTGALDRAYRALQSEVHPDRHAAADDAQRRLALQASARVNEAYRTLKDPVARAEYLLALHGVDSGSAREPGLPLAFLERQLERRELADDAASAGDLAALVALQAAVRMEAGEIEEEVSVLLERGDAFADARVPVRELRFLTKLHADIDAMVAALDE
jgi:molecular chaperone HscB